MMSGKAHDGPPTARTGPLLAALAVMVLSIAGNANVTLKPLIISSYVSFLGFDRSSSGLLVSCEAAATGLSIAIAVNLLDRVGQSRMLLGAATLVVLGNLLTILAPGHIAVGAARIVAGTGHGATVAVCAAAVARFAGAERISAFVAAAVGIAGTGLMLTIPVLQGAYGAWPLFAAMALLIVAAMPVWRWLPRPSGTVAGNARTAMPPNRGAAIWISLAAAAGFYLGVGGFWPYAAEYGRLAGLSYQQASQAAGLAYMAAVAGSACVMVLGRHVARSPGMAVSILGAVGAQAVLLMRSHDPLAFRIACTAFMFFWGIFYPLLMGFLSELDRSGRANGYFATLATAAFAIGPALGGLVIGLGRHAGGDLTNLLWVSMASQTAALIIVPVALGVARRPGGTTAPDPDGTSPVLGGPAA